MKALSPGVQRESVKDKREDERGVTYGDKSHLFHDQQVQNPSNLHSQARQEYSNRQSTFDLFMLQLHPCENVNKDQQD